MLLFYLIALKITSLSPRFRRFFWRQSYQHLARKYPATFWTFMNYGYAPSAKESPLVLEKQDEANRYFIGLYHYVVSAIDLTHKNVLEVGSGRGGGASYVTRYLKPAQLTGIDISSEAVAFCRTQHPIQNLSFETGDAEALPFNDNHFDTVINIESSHCYGSLETFFQEAYRVLKPKGHFLFADFRPSHNINPMRKLLLQSGFSIRQEEDITHPVIQALELDNDHKKTLIQNIADPKLIESIEQLAGIQGTRPHTYFKNGTWRYVRFVLQK
ncbi:MAG: class I SAM-dependent methyltransferase [Candidatus Latescibacteria bacterium]|nr:class I SAM-dependent methyltransferase [Candidatus Latescibacterota bacterium]MBT4138539.1 class I SAM-dependent methyltransferase [Candidatus Latescibacterota bacterium]